MHNYLTLIGNSQKKIVIIFIVLVIFLILSILIIKENTIVINNEKNKDLYNQYTDIINNIKKNMDYISENNENIDGKIKWSNFKLSLDSDVSIIYDYLIDDIRICYVYFTDVNNEIYSNSNYLEKFVGMDKILKSEFKNLTKMYSIYNSNCLDRFDKYENNLNKNTFENEFLKLMIEPLINYKKYHDIEVESYESLLINEFDKANLIYNITEYLKLRYDVANVD